MIKCNNCNEVYNFKVNFCSTCGNKIKPRKNTAKLNLNHIIAFYISILIYLGVSFYISDYYPNNLLVEIISEFLFLLLVCVFSSFNYKELSKLFKLPKVDNWLILFITLTFINAFIVYYGIDIINKFIDADFISDNYYAKYLYTETPLFWSVVFLAILPPIFEELAFRGYLFSELIKISSIKVTIVITSFLFALIHLSMISFLWIFPFGIFLGYLRWRYNTLLIPMLIHFIHNLTVVLLDYYNY